MLTMWSVRAFASSMTSIHFDLVSSFSKVFHALLTTAINEIFCYIFIALQDILLYIYCITRHIIYYYTYFQMPVALSLHHPDFYRDAPKLTSTIKIIKSFKFNKSFKLYYLFFISKKKEKIDTYTTVFLFDFIYCCAWINL